MPTPTIVAGGLAVYAFGRGAPLLLMPGPHRFQKPGHFAADALITGAVQGGRRVITFDPPASGHSTRRARLGMAEMHIAALDALRACGVQQPVAVMGHGMGGLAALAFALDEPHHAERLLLIATGSGGPAFLEAQGSLWNSSHPAYRRITALSLMQILVPSAASEIVLRNAIEREAFINRKLAPVRAVRPRDWLRRRTARTDWYRVAESLDYSERLGEIRIPTLILCGTHDPLFPPEAGYALADGIPGSRIRFFEQSGHYPFLEEPEPFWRAAGGFLAQEFQQIQ